MSRRFTIAIIGIVLIAIVFGINSIRRIEHQRRVGEVIAVTEQGMAQFRQEKYELSLKTLGSIPEDLIEDWHIPYYKGTALIKLGDYESATVQLEQALALNANEVTIPYALGVAYYKLGNLGLSKAYFAAVLEIDPDHEEAKGLMDIMASLERIQPSSGPDDVTKIEDSDNSSH